MKLTEYFLKLCESCLAEVKKNLKLIDPFGGFKFSLRATSGASCFKSSGLFSQNRNKAVNQQIKRIFILDKGQVVPIILIKLRYIIPIVIAINRIATGSK